MCKPLLQEVSKNEYISKAHCVARFNLCSKRFTWKSNSNQIKIKSILFKLDSVRSGCPISRARGSCIKRSSIPDRIGIQKCWFLRRGENRSTRRKTSRSREENQQQTQPTYDVESGNRTRATLVEGECSHHCAIPAPPKEVFGRRTKHSRALVLLAPKYPQAPSYTG